MKARQILNGVYGGLAGGAVFGMMMGMMGMLPMIGGMVGLPSALGGFLVHMVISVMIGISFAIVFERPAYGARAGFGYGIIYGVIWWFLGPLTLMPLMMGMRFGVNWNAVAMGNMLPSLFGHIVYGLIMGGIFGLLKRRSVINGSRARVAAQENL